MGTVLAMANDELRRTQTVGKLECEAISNFMRQFPLVEHGLGRHITTDL